MTFGQTLRTALAGLAVGMAAMGSAHAADFSFTGTISLNTDVIVIPFTLNTDATDVKVWTDSFNNGANFDPITAVWSKAGSDWAVVAQNDDNPNIAPGQTYWDSGLVFPTLSAGQYLFTVATFDNFANGTLLSQGFKYDGTTPVAIENWWVDGTGYYSLHLSGVDSATAAVPEPQSYAMMLLGLGAVGGLVLRKQRRD